MRIISGKFRSRKLQTIESDALRPTLGRTRESVFNIISHMIHFDGATIMDVFCGTGAYGIEAISRGAALAYFIDNNPSHIELAKNNLATIDPTHQAQFICTDASANLPIASDPVDLIFIDPPYESGLIPKTLELLATNHWLDSNTLIVVEEKKGTPLTFNNHFELLKHKNYGAASIYLLNYCN